MTTRIKTSLSSALCLILLQMQPAFAAKETVSVRAYVNDTCIIADEPFFLPVAPPKDGSEQSTAKFLPLLGLVVGKLTELFINHEIQSSANRYKAGVARKDTRYAATKQMNLYRADFEPAPALAINAKLGCMTIVAANFKPDATECMAAYAPKELAKESVGLPQAEWKTTRTDDSIENQLRRANICVDGKTRAVYEARFEFSADGTAYRLKDAGYRIDSLLTTEKPGSTRTALYTLKISNPSATDQQEVLSSAWVNIGTVKAGSRSHGSGGGAAPWLRVPPLSIEARRNFDEKTKVHQQVTGAAAGTHPQSAAARGFGSANCQGHVRCDGWLETGTHAGRRAKSGAIRGIGRATGRISRPAARAFGIHAGYDRSGGHRDGIREESASGAGGAGRQQQRPGRLVNRQFRHGPYFQIRELERHQDRGRPGGNGRLAGTGARRLL
jgi:hypothetical protein